MKMPENSNRDSLQQKTLERLRKKGILQIMIEEAENERKRALRRFFRGIFICCVPFILILLYFMFLFFFRVFIFDYKATVIDYVNFNVEDNPNYIDFRVGFDSEVPISTSISEMTVEFYTTQNNKHIHHCTVEIPNFGFKSGDIAILESYARIQTLDNKTFFEIPKADGIHLKMNFKARFDLFSRRFTKNIKVEQSVALTGKKSSPVFEGIKFYNDNVHLIFDFSSVKLPEFFFLHLPVINLQAKCVNSKFNLKSNPILIEHGVFKNKVLFEVNCTDSVEVDGNEVIKGFHKIGNHSDPKTVPPDDIQFRIENLVEDFGILNSFFEDLYIPIPQLIPRNDPSQNEKQSIDDKNLKIEYIKQGKYFEISMPKFFLPFGIPFTFIEQANLAYEDSLTGEHLAEFFFERVIRGEKMRMKIFVPDMTRLVSYIKSTRVHMLRMGTKASNLRNLFKNFHISYSSDTGMNLSFLENLPSNERVKNLFKFKTILQNRIDRPKKSISLQIKGKSFCPQIQNADQKLFSLECINFEGTLSANFFNCAGIITKFQVTVLTTGYFEFNLDSKFILEYCEKIMQVQKQLDTFSDLSLFGMSLNIWPIVFTHRTESSSLDYLFDNSNIELNSQPNEFYALVTEKPYINETTTGLRIENTIQLDSDFEIGFFGSLEKGFTRDFFAVISIPENNLQYEDLFQEHLSKPQFNINYTTGHNFSIDGLICKAQINFIKFLQYFNFNNVNIGLSQQYTASEDFFKIIFAIFKRWKKVNRKKYEQKEQKSSSNSKFKWESPPSLDVKACFDDNCMTFRANLNCNPNNMSNIDTNSSGLVIKWNKIERFLIRSGSDSSHVRIKVEESQFQFPCSAVINQTLRSNFIPSLDLKCTVSIFGFSERVSYIFAKPILNDSKRNSYTQEIGISKVEPLEYFPSSENKVPFDRDNTAVLFDHDGTFFYCSFLYSGEPKFLSNADFFYVLTFFDMFETPPHFLMNVKFSNFLGVEIDFKGELSSYCSGSENNEESCSSQAIRNFINEKDASHKDKFSRLTLFTKIKLENFVKKYKLIDLKYSFTRTSEFLWKCFSLFPSENDDTTTIFSVEKYGIINETERSAVDAFVLYELNFPPIPATFVFLKTFTFLATLKGQILLEVRLPRIAQKHSDFSILLLCAKHVSRSALQVNLSDGESFIPSDPFEMHFLADNERFAHVHLVGKLATIISELVRRCHAECLLIFLIEKQIFRNKGKSEFYTSDSHKINYSAFVYPYDFGNFSDVKKIQFQKIVRYAILSLTPRLIVVNGE